MADSMKVVRAVAAKAGVTTRELDSVLGDVIDPEALDALVESMASHPTTEGFVQFEYCGYTVCVHADETVNVG